MQEVIWEFLNLSMEDGRIVTARLDAHFKMSILRGLAQKHMSAEQFDNFTGLLGTITDLYVDRNFIAHGKWLTLQPENVPAAASLRDKVDKALADPTDVVVETFPSERMRTIINEMYRSKVALIHIRDALSTLRGRHSEPPGRRLRTHLLGQLRSRLLARQHRPRAFRVSLRGRNQRRGYRSWPLLAAFRADPLDYWR